MNKVTLQLIMEYLERFGWKNYEAVKEPSEQEGIIYTGWKASEHSPTYMLSIDPMIEKKCISFRTQSLIQAPYENISHDCLLNILLALHWINFRIIVGKFSYEPVRGEVRFSIDFPIDENTLSYAQFVHSLGLIVEIVEIYVPLIKKIKGGELTAEKFIQHDLQGDVLLEKQNLTQSLKDLLRGLGRINWN